MFAFPSVSAVTAPSWSVRKKPHTEARVALDHHFRRMSKRVSFAYRSDRDSRHDYRKKLIRRGCFAAVVRNLEEIRGERSAVGDEAVFGLSLDVAGHSNRTLPSATPTSELSLDAS